MSVATASFFDFSSAESTDVRGSSDFRYFDTEMESGIGGTGSNLHDELPAAEHSDFEDFEETGYSGSGWLELCCINTFAPCFRTCQVMYHFGRSIPANTFLWTVCVTTGWIIFRTNLSNVNSDLDNTGLSIEWYSFPIDFMCAAIFVVDLFIVIASALLTGWTLEAICESFNTGTFETHENGRDIKCSCFLTEFLKKHWWCSLHMITAFTYVAGGLAILILLTTTCGWFVAYCLIQACRNGEAATTQFMDVVSDRFSSADIGDISYTKYCTEDDDLRNDISDAFLFMFVGQCMVLGGQLALFGTMTDNLRIAKSERYRHTNPDEAPYQLFGRESPSRLSETRALSGRLDADHTF